MTSLALETADVVAPEDRYRDFNHLPVRYGDGRRGTYRLPVSPGPRPFRVTRS